jgi:hypothetical protein
MDKSEQGIGGKMLLLKNRYFWAWLFSIFICFQANNSHAFSCSAIDGFNSVYTYDECDCWDSFPGLFPSIILCSTTLAGITQESFALGCSSPTYSTDRQYAISLGLSLYDVAAQPTDVAFPYVCDGVNGWCQIDPFGGDAKYYDSTTVEGGECYAAGTSSSSYSCQYTFPTCTTPSYCKSGYYKSGSTCIPCPDGGTSINHNQTGITGCYKLMSDGSDSAGTYNWATLPNNRCYYTN